MFRWWPKKLRSRPEEAREAYLKRLRKALEGGMTPRDIDRRVHMGPHDPIAPVPAVAATCSSRLTVDPAP